MADETPIERIPRLQIAYEDCKTSGVGRVLTQEWNAFARSGNGAVFDVEKKVAKSFFMDDDTPRATLVAAAVEAVAWVAMEDGIPPSDLLSRIEADAVDGKLHPAVGVGRLLKAGTDPHDWRRVVAEFEIRCGHLGAFAGHAGWPDDYADSRPELASHLTRAIEEQIDEWLTEELIEKVYDVGSGLCHDFAEAIAKRMGVGGRGGYGPIGMTFTEEFCRNDRASRKLLTEAGETIPSDIPFGEFAKWFDRATHQWIEFGGRYYDATAPEGVDRFLDLPFFADQIESLRNERRPTPS